MRMNSSSDKYKQGRIDYLRQTDWEFNAVFNIIEFWKHLRKSNETNP